MAPGAVRHNQANKDTHYVVENAIGELKNHFRCLTKHDNMIVIDIW